MHSRYQSLRNFTYIQPGAFDMKSKLTLVSELHQSRMCQADPLSLTPTFTVKDGGSPSLTGRDNGGYILPLGCIK